MSIFDSNIDVKSLGKVAVLMGGDSAEREVSLMSGSGVLQALRSRGVDAHAFDPAQNALGDLKRDGYARCFIALHGRHGEDGTVQGALELLRIPYTGPGVMASAIAMDKVMTKRVWLAEVYAAGEAPIVAADGRSLTRALRVAGKVEPLFVDDIADLPQTIASSVRGGDVVICMGAGSIGAVPGKVVDMLSKSELIAQEGRAL